MEHSHKYPLDKNHVVKLMGNTKKMNLGGQLFILSQERSGFTGSGCKGKGASELTPFILFLSYDNAPP